MLVFNKDTALGRQLQQMQVDKHSLLLLLRGATKQDFPVNNNPVSSPLDSAAAAKYKALLFHWGIKHHLFLNTMFVRGFNSFRVYTREFNWLRQQRATSLNRWQLQILAFTSFADLNGRKSHFLKLDTPSKQTQTLLNWKRLNIPFRLSYFKCNKQLILVNKVSEHSFLALLCSIFPDAFPKHIKNAFCFLLFVLLQDIVHSLETHCEIHKLKEKSFSHGFIAIQGHSDWCICWPLRPH